MGAMPSTAWESRLHERLTAGDESALAELYDQFGSLVYGLARRVTGDGEAARDVTQQVLVSVWEHPEAFDPARGSLRSWLGTVTHRRAVDHVRREAAARRRARLVDTPTGVVPDIEEVAVSLAVAERVRHAVDALPPDQADAVRLAYFGGRTYREVAVALAIPEGTAKSRLRLALRHLADVLADERTVTPG